MAKPEGPQAPLIPEGVHDPPAPKVPLASPAPHAPQVLQAPQQPILHMLLLNWSHSKPKFSGKPDKDAEVHLLRANDWMDTHRF